MVLLVERLTKLYNKLEGHQLEAEVLAASLQAFRSEISNCLNQLCSNSKPGSEIFYSFHWLQQCFELLPLINRAFAKLIVDIDYPMSSWESATLDKYLNYSLHLLELLNSVSSSLSHLAHARLLYDHALSLMENSPSSAVKHLKAIQIMKSSRKDFGLRGQEERKKDGDKKFSSSKERVVNQALKEIKNIGIWVCGVVLASLSGEAKPYLEIKPLISEVILKKSQVLKEVKELNNAAASLASAIVISGKSSDAAKDLERKSDFFRKQLEGLEKQVDKVFSNILEGRNELLLGVRQRKQ